MPILGIDPGIGVTGFSILDEDAAGRLTYRRSGDVRTDAKTPFPQRLKKIFDHILNVIDTDRPTAVALEDTFMSKNVKSALKLGQARGAAILAAAVRSLPVFEYSPTEVKMAVVGYGGASKTQVQQMVSHFLRLENPLQSEHCADAAAVAICHAHSARFKRNIDRSVEGMRR
ncbi:MAG: crossover junction endodeoxyribonuclease RuvC [Nitrospiria bacterium]